MDSDLDLMDLIHDFAKNNKDENNDVCDCGNKLVNICSVCGMHKIQIILQPFYNDTSIAIVKTRYKPGFNMRRFLMSLYHLNQHLIDYDYLYQEFLKFKVYYHSLVLKKGMVVNGFKGDFLDYNKIVQFLEYKNKKEKVEEYYIKRICKRSIIEMFSMFYNKKVKKDDKYKYYPALYNTIIKRQGIEIKHILTIERINKIALQFQYFRRQTPKWRSVIKYLEYFNKDIYDNYCPLFKVIKISKINYDAIY